jgi:tetratricopeptide (TPR) repeat protein
VRAIVRSAVSTALVTPWIGAAMALANASGRASRWQAAAALLIAALPPGVYAARLVDVRSAGMDTHASTGRLVRARGVLTGLNDIVGEPAFVALRRKLDQNIEAARKGVSRELSPKASISARLTRAFVFIQLDRAAEAEAILAPLSQSDSTAALLLAAVYRDQRRWTDAERTYRSVLEVQLPNVDENSTAAEACTTAYDGLAESLQGLNRPRETSEVYREALMRLPGKRAYYHFKIGLHEANIGRSALALTHLAAAVRLDAKFEPQAGPHMRRLRVETPICLTSRTGKADDSP